MSTLELAIHMATQTPIRPTVAPAEGMTEFFDGIACLDERVRRQATPLAPQELLDDHLGSETGCYIEVQGPGERLLIPLGSGVTHIGRGLAADLRLDEDSVRRAYETLKPMDAMIRLPNVFGPKLEPPVGADLQTEFLYFLGRRA